MRPFLPFWKQREALEVRPMDCSMRRRAERELKSLGQIVVRTAATSVRLDVEHQEAPPGYRAGLGGVSLLAVLARPRPQQGVAFATFVVEQVRVDRRVEGGIVEFER